MPRELPPLSHLQFLALGVILSNDEPGRVIRDVVADYGVRRTGAAFYQLMARLERDGLVGDGTSRSSSAIRPYANAATASRQPDRERGGRRGPSTRPSPPRPRRGGGPVPDPRLVRALSALLPRRVVADAFEPAWEDLRVTYLIRRQDITSPLGRAAQRTGYVSLAVLLFLDCWRLAIVDWIKREA